MLRFFLALSLAVIILSLMATSEVQAWGGFHVGYTHVGYGGVEHWGRTGISTPYGSYYGGRTAAYGRYGGVYHSGYGYGAGYGYGYGGAGAYRYDGYHAGYYGGYGYRRW